MSRTTSLATRKQRRHAEELRKHIQISRLIDRLIDHVCSAKPLMDESQVQSALDVLNKLLPDLSVTQLITDDADSPLAITESD
jgi:ribonuclease PH